IAEVAELADAPGSGPGSRKGSGGSSPLFGTRRRKGVTSDRRKPFFHFQTKPATTDGTGDVSSPVLFPKRQSLARLQRHDGKGGARMADEVIAVGAQRAREPAARHALIAPQPGDPLLDRFITGGHARLTQNVDDQPGRVAIAGGVAVV